MDIDLSFDEENPMALKADFILSLMELIVGGKDGLQPVERTVIDRCVRQMYREHLQNPETAKMPTLQTLYDLLCSQPEGEAVRLATALEIYVSGSLNVFRCTGNICRTRKRRKCRPSKPSMTCSVPSPRARRYGWQRPLKSMCRALSTCSTMKPMWT